MATLGASFLTALPHTTSSIESKFETINDARKNSGGKAKHCITTIEALNDKISGLKSELHFYAVSDDTRLISEDDPDEESSRSSPQEQRKFVPSSPKGETVSSINAKERKQVEIFSGLYATYTILTKEKPSKIRVPDAVKRQAIQKSKMVSKETVSASSNKKPLLVELYTFPGFSQKTMTPLPASLSAASMAYHVIESQYDINRMPSFKRELHKCFSESKSSQDLLQDIFWWFFCEKYQPNSGIQRKLFRRISTNYTHHLIYWIGSPYQKKLFQRFPDLICQGVYATFSHAFPESYKKFDDNFKQGLLDIVYLWMNGTRPAPEGWKSWNFDKLGPAKMRQREIMERNAASDKAKPMAFDLSYLTEEISRARSSSADEKQNVNSSDQEACRGKRVNRLPETSAAKEGLHGLNVKDDIAIDDAQSRHLRSKYSGLERRRMLTPPAKSDNETGLTTMESLKTQRQKSTGKCSRERSYPSSPFARRANRNVQESCTTGKGPKFCKVVFDVFGRSPLVEYYMQRHGLSKDAGTIIYMQRTEIEKLPPRSFMTYKELIKSRLKASRLASKRFKQRQEQSSAERLKVTMKWNELLLDHRKKCERVLQNPHEVRKLSDLLGNQGEFDDSQTRKMVISAALSEALGYNSQS